MDVVDKEYVQRCRDGHPEDFRALVDRYQKSVFSFLTAKLGNRLEAEEATQESFVRAFVSLKKLRKSASFHSWLLGIAGRVAHEKHRIKKRRRLECDVEENMAAVPSTPPEMETLDEAIAALPETYRRLVLMRYYEGLSCREVGERLEMPLGTVTKMLSRAYELLRKELRKHGNSA